MCGGSAHSSNGNQGASRKRLKLWQLTNAAIAEVHQNWRMLYKAAVGGDGFPGLLLFVNILLDDDLRGVTCSTMFLQMPFGELLLGRGDRRDMLVDQNQGGP
jgi:hypothetical protein